MANILQTTPYDWKYVSEGGATIVFSYIGSTHADFDGMVLRLRKSLLENSAPEIPNNVAEEELDDPTIEYQTKCMQRLIPIANLPRLQTVHLDRSWLEKLARFHNSTRPEDRRAKDEVDLNRKKGVLATDLVGGNWLAVEIKPKWAFLPSLAHLSCETKTIKMQTCRFCMHSHLRAQKSQEEITDYCPLDLFSGEKKRVLKAIRSLWDAWVASNATVNNLKVFARGKFVTPSEAHLMVSEGEAAGIELNSLRDAFSSALVETLLRTPVLGILSDLQRNLDALDIEGLSRLWRLAASSALPPSLRPHGSVSTPSLTPLGVSSPYIQVSNPSISDWIDFVDNYTLPHKPKLDHSNPSPEDLHYYILAYLLSATFKDCSIIVKLDFLRDLTSSPAELAPNSVTVIDLDPKKVEKLKGWEQLDQEIVRTYASANKKTCIDAWQTPTWT